MTVQRIAYSARTNSQKSLAFLTESVYAFAHSSWLVMGVEVVWLPHNPLLLISQCPSLYVDLFQYSFLLLPC